MEIGYGVCVGPSGSYEIVCEPALDKYRNPDRPVGTVRNAESQFAAYNRLLDEAAANGCDALVLLHDDVELRADPAPVIEEAFADPEIALLGTLGGRGAVSIAWWRELAGRRGYVEDRRSVHQHSTGLCQVDAIDDLLLVASRWTIENIRFPAGRYQGFEGLGVIMATLVRAAGKRAAVSPMDVMHHNDGIGFNGITDWRRNELRWQRDFFSLTTAERIRNVFEDAMVPTLPARLAVRRVAARLVGGLSPVPNGESGEPVLDRYVERWLSRAQSLHGRHV